MNIKTLMVIMLASLTLTGCSSSEAEEVSRVQEGLQALENKSYEIATDILSDELNKNGDDIQLRNLYRQAMCLRNAEKLKVKGMYRQAIKEFDYIEGVISGSSIAKRHIDSLQDEIETKIEEEEEAKLKRKEQAKISSAKNIKEIEAMYEAELEASKESGHKGFSDILNDVIESEGVQNIINGIKDKLESLKRD